jgi:predicted AlkP superfamily phosphohydrolase/phosphomutase
MKSKEKAIINRSPRGKVSRKKRVCVISLDGVPGELLEDAFSQGRLTALRSLWESGGWAEITSTLPPVSAVAWATYATGVGPGHR